ncbi:hypothetical protein F4778DRAFT_247226 [Xylariomycetidae sp. FL2044]|nr:hypothetical protein F4778DRAFT_247226 [Xylariomycetidae sp. FL2044]
MKPVGWHDDINFTSALLLHSCITVLLKELLNVLFIAARLASSASARSSDNHGGGHGGAAATAAPSPSTDISGSVVLDGYTSILSHDHEGETAELYFTNTGLLLLPVSLASAITMNLYLSGTALNVFVAGTFGFCYLVSVLAGRRSGLRLVLALRRAGRFIWSDTPFVNFFTLIYVAVVMQSSATLRVMDYVALRSVAIVELIFMKAYIAAASPTVQLAMLRALLRTRRVLVGAGKPSDLKSLDPGSLPLLSRNSIQAFTTAQRMSVMLFKTTVAYDGGSVRGSRGPAAIPVPPVGCFTEDPDAGQWRVYRVRSDVMVVEDCLRETSPGSALGGFIRTTHGILLRAVGKVRVVYLIRDTEPSHSPSIDCGCCRNEGDVMGSSEPPPAMKVWRSSVNFVSGVSKQFLEGYSRVPSASLEREMVV